MEISNPCSCGSGEPHFPLRFDRGGVIARVCSVCRRTWFFAFMKPMPNVGRASGTEVAA